MVIGGSAGSLDVVLQILGGLQQKALPPIVIVMHRKSAADSLLTDLLSHKTHMVVKEVEEKEVIQENIIYLAPADYHLLIEKDRSFSLDYSEKVNYSRPSIDVVFQSAADVYGRGLICILLSGANADGSEGFVYVQARGGTTIAQDPSTASVPYMPESAIGKDAVTQVLNIRGITDYINSL